MRLSYPPAPIYALLAAAMLYILLAVVLPAHALSPAPTPTLPPVWTFPTLEAGTPSLPSSSNRATFSLRIRWERLDTGEPPAFAADLTLEFLGYAPPLDLPGQVVARCTLHGAECTMSVPGWYGVYRFHLTPLDEAVRVHPTGRPPYAARDLQKVLAPSPWLEGTDESLAFVPHPPGFPDAPGAFWLDPRRAPQVLILLFQPRGCAGSEAWWYGVYTNEMPSQETLLMPLRCDPDSGRHVRLLIEDVPFAVVQDNPSLRDGTAPVGEVTPTATPYPTPTGPAETNTPPDASVGTGGTGTSSPWPVCLGASLGVVLGLAAYLLLRRRKQTAGGKGTGRK